MSALSTATSPGLTTTSSCWEDSVAEFWARADASRPEDALQGVSALLMAAGPQRSAAIYEWAAVHEFLGRDADAIPFYEMALAGDLDPSRRERAAVQLASCMRNVGRPHDAALSLRLCADGLTVGAAPRAFLALALHDIGDSGAALRIALTALAETLPVYQDAIKRYACALTPSA